MISLDDFVKLNNELNNASRCLQSAIIRERALRVLDHPHAAAPAPVHEDRGFDWCPAEVLNAQKGKKIKSGMSHIEGFLALHKDHEDAVIGPVHSRQVVYTERSDHLSTTIQSLNEAFMDYMRDKEPHRNVKVTEKINRGTMERLGYEVRKANYCKHCNMNSTNGPCCDKYDREQRSNAQVVVGLILIVTWA